MFAIVNAVVDPVVKPRIEGATVVVENGRIKAVGRRVKIPAAAECVDAAGRLLTPGFVDCHSHAGLKEDGMMQDNDVNERTDPVTPRLRALDAFRPTDVALLEAAQSGVTTIFVTPGSANVIGGQSIAMKTYGKVIDHMVVKEPAGLKIAFGENPKRVYGEQKKMPATRMATAALLREALVNAQNYKVKLEKSSPDKDKTVERDLKMEVLCDVLDKKLRLRAHAHRADDIMTAVRIAKEFDVDMVIEHCTEGHLIADELAELDIPAVVGPSFSSRSKVELKNLSFITPGILAAKGVKVAIMTDHPVIPIQYLPVCAALAVREGMKEEDALAAITINAAEILGIADRLGSLEKGKDADVVVWNGHPLDIKSKPSCVVINGEIVYENCKFK